MNKTYSVFFLLGFALLLIILSQAFFIVDQREQAIVLQLGQPVGNANDPASFIKGPGLHTKIPLIQDVRRFDRRILSVDANLDQVVISSFSFNAPAVPVIGETTPETPAAPEAPPPIQNVSGEPIIVDTFARYRITDPLQFLKTLRTTTAADARLQNILNDTTRAILGQTTLKQLLSPERTKVMATIRQNVNRKIQQDKLGIEIVDVRIVRADLTSDLRTSTVRRMISELLERATETRANGEERALEIRSTAEKERAVILAEAERDAQILRGEGDKEAIGIYTKAFNKDKEFYAFTRTMEAYKKTLSDPETQLILSPNSDFLRYFQSQSGTGR